MLFLLLDAAVLIGLYVYFSDGESLSWGKALLTAFAISIFSYFCIRVLFDSLGMWCLLPCLLVAPVMLWLICDLPIKLAAIAGSIFTAYRILVGLVMVYLF